MALFVKAVSWIRAARPLSLLNIGPPLLLGAQAAGGDAPWITLLAGGWLGQLAIVFLNDYADRGRDAGRPTWISGGSGVLPRGELRPRQLKAAGMLAAEGYLLCFAWLGALSGNWLLPLLALLGLGLFLSYSYPPFQFNLRGGGEFLQALGVGGVLPLLGLWAGGAQAGALAGADWAFLLGTALVAAIATTLPDREEDRKSGKRTLCVLIGRAPLLGLLWLASLPLAWLAPFNLLFRLGLPLVLLLALWLEASAAIPQRKGLVQGLLLLAWVQICWWHKIWEGCGF